MFDKKVKGDSIEYNDYHGPMEYLLTEGLSPFSKKLLFFRRAYLPRKLTMKPTTGYTVFLYYNQRSYDVFQNL